MADHMRVPLRLGFGALLLMALLALLHIRISDPTSGSLLVVAAQTTAGTIQDCRTLSEEELAALPQHMRRKEVCDTRAVPYQLDLWVDDTLRLQKKYTAAGIHGDRPITIAERVGVTTGPHAVKLVLAPAETSSDENGLPTFSLEQTIDFEAGRIRVTSLDERTGQIQLH